MINVAKMKKMVKETYLLWGVEGDYMLVTDGYRAYKDKIDSFDPKMKAALFAEFGRVPEKGETWKRTRPSKLDKYGKVKIEKTSSTVSGILGRPEYLEKPVFYTGMTFEGWDILRVEEGLAVFNSDFFHSLKNPEEATIHGNGKAVSMARFTFDNETMEYYLLPISTKNLEARVKEKLGFNVEK